jgi:hypothetical protein
MLIDYTLRPRIPHELLVVIGGWSGGSVTNSVELFDCRANVWLDFKDNDESMFDKLYFISNAININTAKMSFSYLN